MAQSTGVSASIRLKCNIGFKKKTWCAIAYRVFCYIQKGTKGMEFNKATQKVCACCGDVKRKNAFFVIPRQEGEYIPFCKDCVQQIFVGYKNELASTAEEYAELAALWSTLFRVNLPFYYDLAVEAQKKAENNVKMTLFEIYLTLLKNSCSKCNSVFDGDTNMTELFAMPNKPITEQESLSEVQQNKYLMDWGQYTPEEWAWLENKYHEHTDSILQLEPAGVDLYRQLCKDQLRLRQAYEQGEETKVITDEIFKIMKTLKIDNFESNEKSATEKHIERLAWKFENTEPAELEDESIFKDVAGYEQMYHEIMRSQENFIRGSKNYPAIPKDAL